MGQKVHPIGLRLGIIKDWESRWYVKKNYADLLHEDLRIRESIEKYNKQKGAGIGKVEINRYPERVNVYVFTSKPGIVIGKKGSDVDTLKIVLQKLSTKKLNLYVNELKNEATNAVLVAANVAKQIEGKISYKRAMKSAIQSAMKSGAKGIKIYVGGRLAGAEMARCENYKEGRIPLHTLRANIEYSRAEANTTFGKIGVKVWIYKGDVFTRKQKNQEGLILKKKDDNDRDYRDKGDRNYRNRYKDRDRDRD